jgi:hypothetical protein
MTSDRLPADRDPGTGADAAFDARARQAHAAALEQLSPRVRAQLAQRRRAALDSPRRAPLPAWPMLALGSAAALVLVVGIALRMGGDEKPAGASVATTTVPTQVGAPTQAPTDASATTTRPWPNMPPDATASATPAVGHIPLATAEPLPDASDPAQAAYPFADRTATDASPEMLLAAEFDAGADAGIDPFEENPDFYLWLGSEESSADVTESL